MAMTLTQDDIDAIVAAISGGGTVPFPYTVIDNIGNPIAGARVVVTTDEDGMNKYTEAFTNEFGVAMFHLTPAGWWFWPYYAGYRPPVGERPDYEEVA